jgi:N-acetylglucosamine kinase
MTTRIAKYLIGVDVGASKTAAIVGSDLGEILGRGYAGSSNYHNVGISGAVDSIKRAVNQATRGARIRRQKVEIAVVALAGIDSARDLIVAKQFVRRTNLAHQSFVVHDSIAYLQSAFRNGSGIIVESGTGSVAAGVNSYGKYVRVGGWGAIVDDYGSGYDIGRRALNAAFRAVDGRGPATSLVPAIKHKFRLKTIEELPSRIRTSGVAIDEIASLANLVSKAACQDEVSRKILRDAGVTLGELACAVARRLDLCREPVRVATIGGVFKAGRYLNTAFTRRVKRECPLARIFKPDLEPDVGAFLLAVQKSKRA